MIHQFTQNCTHIVSGYKNKVTFLSTSEIYFSLKCTNIFKEIPLCCKTSFTFFGSFSIIPKTHKKYITHMLHSYFNGEIFYTLVEIIDILYYIDIFYFRNFTEMRKSKHLYKKRTAVNSCCTQPHSPSTSTVPIITTNSNIPFFLKEFSWSSTFYVPDMLQKENNSQET